MNAAVGSAVTIHDLHRSFRMGATRVHALNGVDLELERASFTTIMGPSGSGKSTLLYLLGGLDRATSGRIVVEGRAIDTIDENALALFRRSTIGFIFQSFFLIPTLTALENVAFPTRFARVPRRERQRRAYELLQRVGLGDRMQHRPPELSGGQQQRVAIARALVNNPSLILADEPTGNLDTSSGHSIMQLLAELHGDGRTVLVVTHDLRMRAYATNTLYMIDGRLVPESEYERATMIGAGAFLSGKEGAIA